MQPSKWEVWPWNWRKVRKANISGSDREIFERYGETVVASILASNPSTTEIHAYIAGQDYEPSSQGRRREARDWLTECRDAHERREQRLETIEIGVVALITIEIFLSLLFGFLGLWEGWKQKDALDKEVTVLNQMNKNTADTAAQIKRSADAQTESAQLLKVTNDKLQASLTTTGRMASAASKQLTIVETEQAERAAELKKRPNLVMYCGDGPTLRITTTPGTICPVETQSETAVTLHLYLGNEGDKTATATLLRVLVFSKNAAIESMGFQRAPEQTGTAMHTYLLYLGNIRPRTNAPIIITFTFPKEEPAFPANITVDADEIASGTPLGTITIGPRTIKN